MSQSKQASILDSRILVPAIAAAFKKLNPRTLARECENRGCSLVWTGS